ncbi:MAG: prolyl oligopeptidase family serine peptidase [Fibrobacteres bacterium]|nr:prolyl oligopeptidase family serine peptidase [Fibrobacterota bacterium]
MHTLIRRVLCSSLLLAFAFNPSRAASGDSKKMLDKTFQSTQGAIKYLLFVPKGYSATGTQRYPLVVCLRGAGNTYTGATDNFDQAHPWIEDSIQARVPHFVLVPECISDSWGGMSVGGGPGATVLAAPSVAVVEVIEDLKKQYSLDTNRFIIHGFSIGGAGTYHLIEFKPNYFAAAIPCSAGGDSTKIDLIAKTPIWHHQGLSDNAGGAGIRMEAALESHHYKTVKVTVTYNINTSAGWASAVAGNAKPEDIIFKGIQAPVTLDSLKRAIAGGANYINTFMTGGTHEAGFIGAAHNPLLAIWAFSKVRGGSAVSIAPKAAGGWTKRSGATLAFGGLDDKAGAIFTLTGQRLMGQAQSAERIGQQALILRADPNR